MNDTAHTVYTMRVRAILRVTTATQKIDSIIRQPQNRNRQHLPNARGRGARESLPALMKWTPPATVGIIVPNGSR